MLIFPTLIFAILFFQKIAFTNVYNKMHTGELIKWIKEIRPLIVFIPEREMRLTEIYYHLLIALLAIIFYTAIEESKGQTLVVFVKKRLLDAKNVLLFIAILMLLLYFIVPNSASAGMMSDRLCLVFYLFLISWIACNKFPNWLSKFAIAIVCFVNLGLVFRNLKSNRLLNNHATTIASMATFIKPYSVVLPLNNSENWLEGHFSNYLGIDKPLIILENYEADGGWFPIKWNKNNKFSFTSDNSKQNFTSLGDTSENLAKEVEYVLVYGNNNKVSVSDMAILQTNYTLIEVSSDNYAKLYQLK